MLCVNCIQKCGICSKKMQILNIFFQYMYEIIDDLSQSKGTINKVGLACLVYVRIYMIKAETTMRQAPRFSLALNFCLKLRLWVGYSTIFSWVFFSGLYRKERKQLENESRKVSASQKLLRRLHSSSRKQRVKKIDAFKTFFLRLPPPPSTNSLSFWKSGELYNIVNLVE